MSVQSAAHLTRSVSSVFFQPMATHLLAVAQEWRTRRALRKTLGAAPDRQLRDVGLVRSDVDVACDGELSQSAASALRAAARRRAGNW